MPKEAFIVEEQHISQMSSVKENEGKTRSIFKDNLQIIGITNHGACLIRDRCCGIVGGLNRENLVLFHRN
jgi:hypothetical protein